MTSAARAERRREQRDARQAASAYTTRGWSVVPIPPRAKAPVRDGWQRGGYTVEDIDPDGNIGLLLGAASGGLVDVDLDSPAAIAAAAYYLPQTDMLHGRTSARAAHYWYVLEPAPAQTVRYRDPRGATLIELRSTGGQTVVPPSVHPSGEPIAWERDGEPARVDCAALQTAVRRIAAVAMLAPRWLDGARHDAALALAGLLLRGGMADHDAERMVEVVARVADDPEWRDRVRGVRDTAAAIASGEPATGGRTLAELLADGDAVVTRLCQWLDLRGDPPRVRVVSVAELLTLDLPPREMVLDPILPTQGLAMLYGPRGAGKTWLLLAMAYAIAAGAALLRWRAPQPRRVAYLDGEMPASVMRERLARLIRGYGIEAPADHLLIVTPDLQPGPMPDLATDAGQRALAPLLDRVDVVIADSISTLTSAAESEADEWLPLQRWALAQRRAGRSVVLGHHAGKGGQQRGTSRREDVLDTVLALRRPRDYSAEQGARCELAVDKGRGIHGDDARTIEVALSDDGQGGLVWTHRSLDEQRTAQVAAMVREGYSHRSIATELGIGVASVSRHRRRAVEEGLLDD